MSKIIAKYVLTVFISCTLVTATFADNQSTVDKVKQQAGQAVEAVTQTAGQAVETVKQTAGQAVETVKQTANQAVEAASAQVNKVATDIEQSQQAKELTAGILKPIYQLAEAMSFSAFHWLAFALMLAGVISWALQLVLGKLIVASQGGFDIREVISDATVLLISLIGLVLTTQAATENSTFTQSTVSVLSSALAGLIFGIVLYLWGQAQELEASKAREQANKPGKRH